MKPTNSHLNFSNGHMAQSNAVASLFMLLVLSMSPFCTTSATAQNSLTNGASYDSALVLNGTNTWTFEANAGDNIYLRAAELTDVGGLYLWLRLYSPSDALITTDNDSSEARISYVATSSGTYKVLVSSYYAGDSGSYRIRLAKVPGAFLTPAGDESGILTNGAAYDGAIDVGDDDFWTFTATAGDNILLHGVKLSGTGSFYPWIRLYSPSGALITTDYDSSEARISYVATSSGEYTLLVGSYYTGNSGSYRLRMTKVPGAFVTPVGDQSGILTNGAASDGAIDVGDDDFWTFTANPGDNILLHGVKLSGTGSFYPWIRLYSPSGALITTAYDSSEARIGYVATSSGEYTLLVGSYYSGNSGSYRLRMTKVPGAFVVPLGDEGGSLTSGVNHDGAIDLGDVDPWKFTACKGERINVYCLKLTGTGSFYVRIQLYDPNGVLITSDYDAALAHIDTVANSSGTYTLLVSSYYTGNTGTYRLTDNGLSDQCRLCIPAISGPNLNLTGIGGTPNGTLILFTATNVATPQAMWTPVLTNQFDQYGVFTRTSAFDPNERQRYFRFLQQ